VTPTRRTLRQWHERNRWFEVSFVGFWARSRAKPVRIVVTALGGFVDDREQRCFQRRRHPACHLQAEDRYACRDLLFVGAGGGDERRTRSASMRSKR
jgi:hypothetical protein